MKLLAKLQKNALPNIPAGWYTIDEMAERENYSSANSFRPTLQRAVKAGLVAVKEFRVIWGNQSRMRPHYRYAK